MGNRNSSGPRRQGGGGGLLALSGGHLGSDLDGMDTGETEFNFETRRIVKWTRDDIGEWLTEIGFGPLVEDVTARAQTGADLVEIDFDDPVFSGLEDVDREVLKVYLYHLKKCVHPKNPEDGERAFEMKFHRVFRKILRGVGVGSFRFQHMEAHTSILSDWQRIKRFLLDAKKGPGGTGINAGDSLKVKLIITESVFTPKEQLLRRVLSPVVSMIPNFGPKFGLFHAAILIGPFYLHWTDSELIIPKKMIESSAAFISIDSNPLTLETNEDFEIVKTKLAKIIEKWNSAYSYAQMPKRRSEGNCQDFIFDVAQQLGIDLQLDGDNIFSKFLRKMKTRGVVEMEFSPCSEFIEEFRLRDWPEWDRYHRGSSSCRILFESHCQLDDFLYWAYKANPMSVTRFVEEYRLLKSFDRAFWLRHLKDQEDESWKPAPRARGREFGQIQAFVCGCPFSDPRATGSYAN